VPLGTAGASGNLEAKVEMLERHFEDLEAQTLGTRDEAATSAKQLVNTLGMVKDLQANLGERFRNDVVEQVSERALQVIEQRIVKLRGDDDNEGDGSERLNAIETANKQLQKQYRSLQGALQKMSQEIVTKEMGELKVEVMGESQRLYDELRKRIKASDGQGERRLAEFEDKLVTRVTEIIATLGGPGGNPDDGGCLEQRLAALESWGTPSTKRLNQLIDKLELLGVRVGNIEKSEEGQQLADSTETVIEEKVAPLASRLDELDSQLKVLLVSPKLALPAPGNESEEGVEGQLTQRLEALEHSVFVKLRLDEAHERGEDSKVQEALLDVNERLEEVNDDVSEAIQAVVGRMNDMDREIRNRMDDFVMTATMAVDECKSVVSENQVSTSRSNGPSKQPRRRSLTASCS